jgi:hypothetical protein
VFKIVFSAAIFTIVLVDLLECCQTIPESVPCSAARSFPGSVFEVAPMSAIFEVTPIPSSFGVTPISFIFGVTPIPGPIIVLPKIVSGSVPKSVVIQGFVPDVVIIHVIELVRGRGGVCDSGVVAVPLSRSRLWDVEGVFG